MKKLTSSLIAAGVIAGASMSAPVMAEGPSMNVGFVTDYVFRGVTQTDQTAAVQGGLDWEKDKFSYGVWGSAFAVGSEIDVYASYDFGPVSVGAIYYWYPLVDKLSPTNLSTYELNVGGDVGPVSLMASLGENSYYYLEAGYSAEIGKGATVDLHVGYTDPGGGGTTGVDYSVGVGGKFGGVDLGLTYASSPLDATAEGKVFLSASKSM